MASKKKSKPIDWGEIIGAVIFIALFAGLILLGLFFDSGNTVSGSFFDDLSKVMQGQYDK